MIKVYAQEEPNIELEGTNISGINSGDLFAWESNGMISVRRDKHEGRVLIKERPYSDFTDIDGNALGVDVDDTVSALNNIFSTPATGRGLSLAEVNTAISDYLIANPVSPRQERLLQVNGGRVYMYLDKRWISVNDDNYGTSTENFNESAGTGAEPIIEWENQGFILYPGETVEDLDLISRINSVEVEDFEIRLILKTPLLPTGWTTGIDNDNEFSTTTLLSTTWNSDSSLVPTNDKRNRVFDINHTVASKSELVLLIKPIRAIGDLSANRYMYINANIKVTK